MTARVMAVIRLLLIVGVIAARPAAAEGVAGVFDFYVLSLSWSPAFCASPGADRTSDQCARRHGLVVHGLWPQYDRRWPENCPTAKAGPSPALVASMRDIMPDDGLVRHEWRRHGRCSGLDAAGYFAALRRAAAAVRVPAMLIAPTSGQVATPVSVETAFADANPGLGADGMAVTCDGEGRMAEIRICLTRDLAFRDCPNVSRASCRRPSVTILPTGP